MPVPSRVRGPAITLSSVTVQRGPDPVVRGLDLDLEAGRVFWIVGPNGAGKTSLLRVLAGLDRPAAGSVQRVGTLLYYHAEMTLPGWCTVGDWERLVGRLLPSSAPPTALRPDLGGSRGVRRLSTGERKRLLLDALLRVPGPLLLDEPYEHLSPDAKAILTGLLDQRAMRWLVVVATNQATGRADRDGGLRLEAGSAHRLRPAAGEPGR